MNSLKAYLPSGSMRVANNLDTQMLSRGRAPSALKRPLLGLNPDLWTTLPDLCAQAAATALLAAPVLEHTFPRGIPNS